MDALDRQVGGTHYKKYKYQPIEFTFKMGYDPAQFSMVKYLTRWQDKGGVEDLEKIIHYAELEEKLGDEKCLNWWRMQEIRRFVTDNDLPFAYNAILVAITIADKEGVIKYVNQIIETL